MTLKWFHGYRTLDAGVIVTTPSGRTSICSADEVPPDPPSPPGECPIVAFNTGTVFVEGELCKLDQKWIHNDLPARMPLKVEEWVKDSEAKWISSTCARNDSNTATSWPGEDQATIRDYQTVVVIKSDPRSITLQGQYAVDNFLDDILVNGVSTGITGEGLGALKNFTITAGQGLLKGDNIIIFRTRQRPMDSSNPHGLLVKWTNLCPDVPTPPSTPDPDPTTINPCSLFNGFFVPRQSEWTVDANSKIVDYTTVFQFDMTPYEKIEFLNVESDDIAVMIVDGDTVDIVKTVRTAPISYTLPDSGRYIIFRDTVGQVDGIQKTILDDQGHSYVFPTVAPGGPGYHVADMESGGFTTREWSQGFTFAEMDAGNWFIAGTKTLRFRFALIICGAGQLQIPKIKCTLKPGYSDPGTGGTYYGCPFVARNTGATPQAGDPCDSDLQWKYVEGGNVFAKITSKRSNWVSPPAGSAWISSVCDSAQTGEVETVRSYSTSIVLPSDDTVSVKGQWAADNFLQGISVNGTQTGISQTGADSFGQLHQFELTRGMGLLTGTNTVIFQTRQKKGPASDPNAHGLLVAWDPTGCLGSTKACTGQALDSCVADRTITIAGGTGAYAAFNGVHTVTKESYGTFWRKALAPGKFIDLRCSNDAGRRWQIVLSGGTAITKRFSKGDDTDCPPNGTYTCFEYPPEGANCSGSVTCVVSA